MLVLLLSGKKVFKLPSGESVRVLDLPGTYSLKPTSLDEEVTRAVCLGELEGEVLPDIYVCVVDATNLHLHLSLVLEIKGIESTNASCFKYDG